MSIKTQLDRVRASIPAGVELVAVSKTHPVQAVREAYDAGQRIFGESRPQEMAAKYEALPRDIEWHMIGHLQTNKVRLIAPFVSLVHSLDSARLAEALQKEAARVGRRLDVLFEIHVAAEQSKTGWDYAALCAWLDAGTLAGLPNLRVRGVMGIATNTDDRSVVRRDFETLRRYRQELAPRFGPDFDILSMGMSGDYPLAVECGSTMVRVGSLIFGQRDYSNSEQS